MLARAKERVLVVDDDQGTRRLLDRMLKGEGYETALADNGLDALRMVEQERPDLILLDLELPGTSGYEVCRALKADPSKRWIPIIILTGHNAADERLRAWDMDADDFLCKPFPMLEVSARCRSLLRAKRRHDQLDSAEQVAFAFARAVEAKSAYTHGHSERVGQYALVLARRLGLSIEECEILRKGSLLHDIGKISVPDEILNKNGSLTAEEYNIVKLHPTSGAHIIEPLRSLRNVIPLIRWHHERCDGRGYPDQLRKSEIPTIVRILSVADVYDSLASNRPYRPAMSPDECFSVLRAEARQGGLDPDLVEVFCDELSPSIRELSDTIIMGSASMDDTVEVPVEVLAAEENACIEAQ